MINGNTIHYISSGMSHTRIDSAKDSGSKEWIKSVIRKMTVDDYQLGFLYNAFTEKRLGELFSSAYADVLCDIHADSGGLQMVTLGKTVTPEIKRAIYAHQAKHSTIAMSFDEIPVTSSGGVNSFATRKFNSHLVDEKAKLSGENLLEQLIMFAECKTKSKPLLIAQGNCLDTYCRWVDVVQKQIPTELLGALGGIALAGASMGNGDLENVRTAFYFTQMDLKFDCKQVHLLGVGSTSRFIPTMVFMKSGLYKNLTISIDSTTHSGLVSRNQYIQPSGKLSRLGRQFEPRVYTELFERFKFFDVDFDDPRELFTYLVESPSAANMIKNNDSEANVKKFIQAKFGLFIVSAKNTLDTFSTFLHTDDNAHLIRKEMITPMRHLAEVKDVSDFSAWERNFAKYIKSNAVDLAASNTLDGLF